MALLMPPGTDKPPTKKQATLVSRYEVEPMLLDRKRFVLRLFALVTSLEPMTVYVHSSYFAKLADEEWDGSTAEALSDSKEESGACHPALATEHWGAPLIHSSPIP